MIRSESKNIIEKSNKLNTMQCYNDIQQMGLTEYRFFCLYLSKLNARNSDARTVIIPLSEFEWLFGVSLHTTIFNDTIDRIMNRKMRVQEDNGKTSVINLYSKFSWVDDNRFCKEIEVTCNYDIVPYLFELRNNYTSYKISNIVMLNSVSKIRMYEICRQYLRLGTIKLQVNELQAMLFCKVTQFRDFTQKVLKPAVGDINKYTDINVSYKKVLSCRRVVALELTIEAKDNESLNDIQDNIKRLVELPPEPIPVKDTISETLESLYYKLEKVYSISELSYMYQFIECSEAFCISADKYITSVYSLIKAKVDTTRIKDMYRYTLAILEKNVNEALTLKASNPNGTYKYDEVEERDRISKTIVEYYEKCLCENKLDLR